MNKNSTKNKSSSMFIPLNKHITQHRRVWRQGWKKLENANSLIREGKVIHSKKVLGNPHEIVNKNLRYTISGADTKLSTKKLHLVKLLSKKFIPSSVWNMFWSRWSGAIVSNMGKDFVMERGRRFSFFKYRFLIKKSIKTYYSLDNKNFKEMSRRASQWPTTAGYKYIFFRNMERRLDVTLVRLGYALHLEHARTLIKEGKIFVDDRVITQADYLLSPASTVRATQQDLPFTLLYREHLKHHPHTWLKFRRRRYRRKGRPKFWRLRRKGSLGKKLSSYLRNLKSENSGSNIEPNLNAYDLMVNVKSGNVSSPLERLKIRVKKKTRSGQYKLKFLKNKLKWRSGAPKRRIRKRTTKMPLSQLADQLICTSRNEALFTHFYKHKDIKLPESMQVLTF